MSGPGSGPAGTDLPLEGIRVVEIAGGIAAAFSARQMSGFGADVVRVEGHPVHPGLTDAEEVYLLAGKRRVQLPDGRLPDLVMAADVVIEDQPPGTLAAWGLDPVALRARKPSLIVLSITPFGQTGPYRDYRATNIVSFAMGGIMSLTGDFHREPLVSGGSQAQYVAGLHGFSATVTACYGVAVHGEGDWIDLSAQECAAGMLELYGPSTAYGEQVHPRMGNQTRAEWGIYPCLDGYIGVFTLQRQVKSLFEAMDDPELYDGPYLDGMYRLEHVEELAAKLYVWTSDKTKEEILAIGRAHKIPTGVAYTPADLLESPGLSERGFWDDVESPEGMARVPGRPFGGVGWRPVGRLHRPGEDTAAVTAEWLADAASAAGAGR